MKKIIQIILFILLISISSPILQVKANPGVHVIVPHSPLNIGDPVYIEFSTDVGEDGTIIIYILGPGGGSILWSSGPKTINGGLLYDITATGVTTSPGTYTVGVEMHLDGGGMLSGQTTFQVIGAALFDFTLTLSPPSATVEQGETATYQIHITYSDPSYAGTVINIQVTGLGLGMHYQLTTGGAFTISTSPTTPPGTYTVMVIGSRGVTHQTSAILIVMEAPVQEETTTEQTTIVETTTVETPSGEEEQRGEEEERRRLEEEQRQREEEQRLLEEEERRRQEEEQRIREEEELRIQEEEREQRLLTYAVLGGLVVVAIILALVLIRRRPPPPQPPKPSIRYCLNCGGQLMPGKPFCSSCGEKVE